MSHLAVPYSGVTPGVGCQQAPEGISPAAVHDGMPRKGPVQVLLNLHRAFSCLASAHSSFAGLQTFACKLRNYRQQVQKCCTSKVGCTCAFQSLLTGFAACSRGLGTFWAGSGTWPA